MAAAGASTQSKAPDNDALIESSFRRLLASIESEREKIRSTWRHIETDSSHTAVELENLRQDTEEWCHAERHKIENEWKRLDKLRERMSILWPSNKHEVLEINCCGKLFSLQKSSLCIVEGSFLNHMFSDAFVANIPRDAEGRFFLHYNPHCFGLVMKFLQDRTAKPHALPPPVPHEQRQNMDLLAQALNLKAFMRTNSIPQALGTSLKVGANNVVQATHSGWQVLAAQDPIPMSGPSYFEVTILANPDESSGGLAIGLCGHAPTGTEVHTIRIKDAVLYNSHVGLVGNNVAFENVSKGIQLIEGSVLGIKHDVLTRSLTWYHNKISMGSCSLKADCLEKMRVLFPIFALYVPGQKIQVDFSASSPTATRAAAAATQVDSGA